MKTRLAQVVLTVFLLSTVTSYVSAQTFVKERKESGCVQYKIPAATSKNAALSADRILMPLMPEEMQKLAHLDPAFAHLTSEDVIYSISLGYFHSFSAPAVFNEPEFCRWYGSDGATLTGLEVKSTGTKNTFGGWSSGDFSFPGLTNATVYFYLSSVDYNSTPVLQSDYPDLRIRVNCVRSSTFTEELYWGVPSQNLYIYPGGYVGICALDIDCPYGWEDIISFSLDLLDFDLTDSGNIGYILRAVYVWTGSH
jgi:hypothetical protein